MKTIQLQDYNIVFNTNGYLALNQFVAKSHYSSLFIVVDSHTQEHCLATFLGFLETTLPIEIIEIPPGETSKTIETCNQVWEALAALNADRKSLIINLGGGVVTDLGGFIACTYKRGIDFINVPTSLLSMVDASVGGKTGVDLGVLKNLIGVIRNPKLVLIDTGFLASLPRNHMRSGLAEMYKHGLIASSGYWHSLINISSLDITDLNALIHESVIIKKEIVEEDPTELRLRKVLNFGHTLGHAIESYFLSSKTKPTLLHGDAIAVGCILESYLSSKLTGLSQKDLNAITHTLLDMYESVSFDSEAIADIIELLKYDKKNESGTVKFIFLEGIGKPVINQEADNELIKEAFDYYNNAI